MMTWTIPMTWNNRVHVNRDMVEKGNFHGIDFDESTTEITFDFEIDGLDSS
jgi:hypothetical protein